MPVIILFLLLLTSLAQLINILFSGSPLLMRLTVIFQNMIFGKDVIRTLPEVCMIWVPVMLLLMAIALLIPRRSLIDRLAGTWLVPQ